MTALTTTQAQFALDLMRAASDADKDTFLSPISIAMALAMTYAGVDGKTKSQMNTVMFGGLSDRKIHLQFREIGQWLSEPKDGYQLHPASRLYAQKGFRLLPEFLNVLSRYYRSELHAVDFKTNASNVAMEINQWANETTKSHINDLLGPDVLDASARLVLINAIYFKGNWLYQFDVDMMHMKSKFLYTEDVDVQVVGIPYQGEDLHMFVFLPKKRFGLADFEKKLTGSRLLTLIRSTQKTGVMVRFPKFKLEQCFKLNDALSSLGMPDLFDSAKADMSKITGDKDLFVSAVIHKAFVEVNEEGSEAAVATSVTIKTKRAISICPSKKLVFSADHPFIFFIGNRDGHLLFIGRYV